jgi:hypothetical protein
VTQSAFDPKDRARGLNVDLRLRNNQRFTLKERGWCTPIWTIPSPAERTGSRAGEESRKFTPFQLETLLAREKIKLKSSGGVSSLMMPICCLARRGCYGDYRNLELALDRFRNIANALGKGRI